LQPPVRSNRSCTCHAKTSCSIWGLTMEPSRATTWCNLQRPS